MKRDMMKTAESVNIPSAYDMTTDEMSLICEMFGTNPFDALSTTFCYGFALGIRAQKAGKLQLKTKPFSEERAAYIEQINRAMDSCNDLGLLDLVYKLLVKSENTAK